MNSKTKSILFVALALTAGMVGAGIVNHFDDDSRNGHVGLMKSNNGFHQVNYSGLSAAPIDFVLPAEASVPTVVHVTTTYPRQSGMGNHMVDPFSFFWGNPNPREMPPQQSTGSGVIISEDGYIVTNNHVVENGDEVNVTLDNKESYKAKVIGLDPSTDLALLKVDANNLPFAAWGNSDQVKVGEWVLAVGNPFNLTSTVTAGIISAKARNIHILPNQKFPIESFIQTDAAVNPGNSGGALVNTRGELIGINAAIASNTGSYSGYSFAIPVNIVKKVVNDLMEYGTVQRGFIGVSIRDLDSEFAKEKEIKSLHGVYVNGLTEDGAAESAGIKEGDVITSINGSAIKSSPELQEQVGRYRPGDKIDVTVMRNGNEKVYAVTLRNKDGNTKVVKNESISMLGATLVSLSDTELDKLNISKGIKVKDLSTGKLKSAGIKEGFIIVSIDNKPVGNVEELTEYLNNKKGGVLIEGVYPNGMRAYYGFGM
ncbi:MAG: Do family serine endopeptidase [Bacteroidia bacterium]|jgi:serine protease Do|nr:Do family serine endopeptidase [Bacteroidota bacterium]MBP6512574.1 Do family serine endopeptidase [Bacteroidia bacterium]MBP7245626.1 Do family serine endopeptidase [Bacteroidia bacterium]